MIVAIVFQRLPPVIEYCSFTLATGFVVAYVVQRIVAWVLEVRLSPPFGEPTRSTLIVNGPSETSVSSGFVAAPKALIRILQADLFPWGEGTCQSSRVRAWETAAERASQTAAAPARPERSIDREAPTGSEGAMWVRRLTRSQRPRRRLLGWIQWQPEPGQQCAGVFELWRPWGRRRRNARRRWTRRRRTKVKITVRALCACLLVTVALAAGPPAAKQRSFATPKAAADALVAAAEGFDIPALLEILGPEGKDLVGTGDAVLRARPSPTTATISRSSRRRDPHALRPRSILEPRPRGLSDSSSAADKD